MPDEIHQADRRGGDGDRGAGDSGAGVDPMPPDANAFCTYCPRNGGKYIHAYSKHGYCNSDGSCDPRPDPYRYRLAHGAPAPDGNPAPYLDIDALGTPGYGDGSGDGDQTDESGHLATRDPY